MNIEVHKQDIVSRFINGDIVFKITFKTEEDKECVMGMVTTVIDYEERLNSHQYTPILRLLPFYIQVAYLYGCLNIQLHKPRDKSFIFWARELRTKIWEPWFTVHPYEDPLFVS